ncbi:hypothetical protein BJY04DRAFT_188543 [Aspergillus karnatakaensis]|uniref:uncharacterized protein n=1 Tax=Aspergillus karnatakaensis TaxID=1810916 RepID=UPI003CCDD7E3
MTGGISLYNGRNKSLRSVEFPDLQYLDSFHALHDALPWLSKLSMPKLERAKTMHVEVVSASDVTLEFPSLQWVDWVRMRGNWSSVHFSELREVNGTFSLCQDENCIGQHGKPAIEYSFSRLEQVRDKLELGGNITSLSMPSLARVGLPSSDETWSQMLKVALLGPPLNASFPRLIQCPNVWFQGNISRLHFPSLRNPVEGFSVFSENELTLDLAIESGDYFSISGASDIHLPNLTHFRSISVNGAPGFDCSGFINDVEKTATSGDRSVYCSVDSLGGLSTGAKAGIGIGVACGAVALMGLAFKMWYRSIAKRNVMKQGNSEELPALSR